MLIKNVRRFALLLCVAAIFTVCVPTQKVYADSPAYVRVREKNVYFYSAPNEDSVLFALVPTYYLRVLGVEGEYYRVELLEESVYFSKLLGYVRIDSVEEINESPLTPLYPTEVISITSSSARVYAQPSTSATSLITATNGQRMGYYGKIISGGVEWYYVCYGEYLGYVNGNYLSMPNLTAHVTPLSAQILDIEIQPEVETVPETDAPKTETGVEQPTLLVLILLIAIPTVTIILLLFLPDGKVRKVKAPNLVEYTTAENASVNSAKPRYFDDYI